MGQTNHLTKRGSVYWLRRRIPTDLLPHYGGKVEISFSLKTKDSAQAAILCRRESVRLDEEFARIRAEHAGTVPTDHDLVEVAGKIIAVPPPQGGWPAPETSPSGVSWEREEFEAQEEALAAQAQEDYAEAAADAAADRFLQALARRGVTHYPKRLGRPAKRPWCCHRSYPIRPHLLHPLRRLGCASGRSLSYGGMTEIPRLRRWIP